MRRRPVLLAATVLATATAAAGLGLAPGMSPALPDGPLLALPALAGNWAAADRIELVHGDQVLWLERRGQVWGLAQEGGYPIRPAAAAALVDALLGVRLLRPAEGTPPSLRLADPPDPAGGTAVRVLSVRGQVLGSLIIRAGPGPILVRRPREPQAWVADRAIPASLAPADWSERRLPPIDPAQILAAARDGEPVDERLGNIAFTAVRAAPQVRLDTPLHVLDVSLADGSAVLAVGRVGDQLWLRVSGTSAWAAGLAAYAFALPDDSRLALP